MKTSNLQPILDTIHDIEKKELVTVLIERPNRSFGFSHRDGGPRIAFYNADRFDGNDEIISDNVSSVYLNHLDKGDQTIYICFENKDTFFIADNVLPGQLQLITQAILGNK